MQGRRPPLAPPNLGSHKLALAETHRPFVIWTSCAMLIAARGRAMENGSLEAYIGRGK